MNVKIAEHAVTFKITEHELHSLQLGHNLKQKVKIGQNFMEITINQDSGGQADDHFRLLALKLVFDHPGACLTLYAPPATINDLANLGRNRAGIIVQQDDLELTLQVDVRSRPSIHQQF